ncbi:DUF134 domain-containing protein [Promethearchaeum syntrophicum]|uniref:DUF134 domain-containing protein n=1 Tax=Promethearchaeum syntrophicum TaxID=2594042 RepID=A0A5B9D6L7_9ARCH|nr:DUF134 domain-containing protein [Candidatus Prometheoarchaeum syntrophicum]QEE14601.1 hypothetical protein DSAG12_00414 [Candidatus Prometheoarchaeum syntrophicum]
MSPRRIQRYVDKESLSKIKLRYNNISKDTPDSAPVIVNLEEYEALRLNVYKGLSQGECAKEFNISQPTFSRILSSAIKKLVGSIVEEKDFEIVAGNITYKDWGGWGCWDCDLEWQSFNNSKEKKCPECGSSKIYRLKKLVTSYSR